jgi:hypothetical protein
MEKLSKLLVRFERKRGRKSVRLWSGPTPTAARKAIPKAIVAQIGYPSSPASLSADWKPTRLERSQAADLLAFLAVESLAYGDYPPPREGLRDAALEALLDLDPKAEFYTNGSWLRSLGWKAPSWTPLSTATFDAGVLGFDDRNAFVFWVEEED